MSLDWKDQVWHWIEMLTWFNISTVHLSHYMFQVTWAHLLFYQDSQLCVPFTVVIRAFWYPVPRKSNRHQSCKKLFSSDFMENSNHSNHRWLIFSFDMHACNVLSEEVRLWHMRTCNSLRVILPLRHINGCQLLLKTVTQCDLNISQLLTVLLSLF